MSKKRAVNIIAALVFCGMLSGCGQTAAEAARRYAAEVRFTGVLPESPPGTEAPAAEEDARILGLMSRKIENEYLALYVGTYYDIALRDKRTGKVFYSGKALYPEDGGTVSPTVMNTAASQVVIEYRDSGLQSRKKTSYPECFPAQGGVKITEERLSGTALKLTYTLGTVKDETIIANALSEATFEALRAKGQELVDSGELRRAEYMRFLNAYNKLSWKALSPEVQRSSAAQYGNLEKLGVMYIYIQTTTGRDRQTVGDVSRLLGIDSAFIAAEEEIVGSYEAREQVTDYFIVPLTYELTGEDLIVRLDAQRMSYTPRIRPMLISILPSFCAGDVTKEGYMFVPDGSGVVIENNASVYAQNQLSVPFFGHDFAQSAQDSGLEAHTPFPVFGITEGDAAMFAIVEGNAAIGGVTAEVSNSAFHYSTVYPWFTYYIYAAGWTAKFSQVTPAAPYAVRYHFLYGEDAGYSGMARYYQQYLEHNGAIRRDTAQNAAGDPINIRLFGTINKLKAVLGFPVMQTLPVTSFDAARGIMDTLKQNGVENVDLVYSEIINGGGEYRAPGQIEVVKQLGGVDGYNAFIDYADDAGYDIFTFADFGSVYKTGNGIDSKKDVVIQLNRETSELQNISRRFAFVNPERFPALADGFLKAYGSQVNNKTVYLPTVGYFLNSNFYEKSEITRTESAALTETLLQKLSAAGYRLKLDGGNVYILPYAESLLNLDLDSSGSRLESYSVPFAAMVLRGYLPFAGPPVNNSGDYEMTLLKSVESGAALYYEIMAESPDILMDTRYTNMYSVEAAVWLPDIIQRYREFRAAFGGISGLRIRAHQRLAPQSAQTTYEDGTRVIVNYADEPFLTEDGIRVEPMGYAVIGGNKR